MGKLKVLSLFSGIGAFEKALTNIGIDYELVGFSEIDKFAIKSYCAIHNTDKNLNLGDITKIKIEDLQKDIDLITHGSPCQDYSVAGLHGGGNKGSGTRSSLMWNTVEIVKHCKPKYVIWENVKNVLSKRHRYNFEQYLKDLENIGYTSYYKVLNAKDFGIPQNRERIYCISILEEHESYEFPEGFKLKWKLKDLLQDNVESKYYLSEKIQNRFTKFPKDRLNNDDLEVVGTIAPNPYDENGNIIYDKCTSAWVYSSDKCISTLAARDYKQPKQILEIDEKYYNTTEKSKELINKLKESNELKEGSNPCDSTIMKPKCLDVANCITARYDAGIQNKQSIGVAVCEKNNNNYRIRKLTPLECWRLMGFDDEDFYKAKSVPTSDTQLYKQAGNSIVVNVLEEIFGNLFLEKEINR